MFLKNLLTVLRQPRMGMEFAAYNASKLMHGGVPIRRLPGDIVVSGFSGFGEYHSCAEFVGTAERAFFASCPMAEGDVIDVGANLGIVSVLLSRRFRDRQVHAFEPNPHTIEALRRNLAVNGCTNAIAHEMAVAGHDGVVTFEAHPTNRATTSISGAAGQHSISIPSVTLDSFMARQGLESLAFLKVDVEGYETVVFGGADKLLGERRAAIVLFEVAPPLAMQAGFKADQPARILQDAGYRLMRLNEDGSLRPGNIAEIHAVVLENWVATRA